MLLLRVKLTTVLLISNLQTPYGYESVKLLLKAILSKNVPRSNTFVI